ncbi:hypothetical protein FRC12_015819 [Ceratobasidium sp. 428]|nr:hypothetical protein FRC12_015819 [Ceratobasidium sp. 428]
MNLRNALWHRSQKQERKEYIGSSLVSFRLASERILAWSRSDDRSRLLTMRFHSEWQHPDCPVMGWYSQQHQSSTMFQSIEHRRSLDGPFFHEFLLVKLTDGAVCRVERTGEGSRADAIRYVGCIAHDLIQWLSEADSNSSSIRSSSELIAEVDLGREFDILDLLAVCYSIQRTKACRAYTLQRYNCYFLCLTILTVLTRRAVSWETKIKPDEWDANLTAMYERWCNLSPDQAKGFPILAICAYLEPDNPRPAQFIFDLLQKHLRSQAEGFAQCKETMRLMLWRADWESELRAGLIESLEAIPDPGLFEDRGYCSQRLEHAVETIDEDSELAIMSCETLLAKNYFKIVAEETALLCSKTGELYDNFQRLWRIEHPISFSKLVLSRVGGGIAGPAVALSPLSMFTYSSYSHRLYSQTSFRAALLKQGRAIFAAKTLDALEKPDAMKRLWDRAEQIVDNEQIGPQTVQILDKLASNGALPPSEVSLVLAQRLYYNRFATLPASLAAPSLHSMLSSLIEAHPTNIRLTLAGPESDNICMTIGDFQESYIKRRIAAHAKRVAAHQLAAAQFVIEDIEETMREVWKGLPPRFDVVESAALLVEAETFEGT